MLLSVCIPTFNRAALLKACLEQAVPQVLGNSDVEIVVSDNASTDHTQEVVKAYEAIPNFRYNKNPENLGMDGNTRRLIEISRGEYIALMSDDDVPLDGYVEILLGRIQAEKPSIIYSNYHSFDQDSTIPTETFFPDEDVYFGSAGEAVLYCGLSHFSAVTFRRDAMEAARKDLQNLEKMKLSRGYVFHSSVIGAASRGSGPRLFLGRRLVGVRSPPGELDYNLLSNICIDFVRHIDFWRNAGGISDEDYRRKVDQVAANLPRAILSHRFQYRQSMPASLIRDLVRYYGSYPKFYFLALPLALTPYPILYPVFYLAREIKRWRRKRLFLQN